MILFKLILVLMIVLPVGYAASEFKQMTDDLQRQMDKRTLVEYSS